MQSDFESAREDPVPFAPPPPPKLEKPTVASLIVGQIATMQDTLSDTYTELIGVQVKQERVEQIVIQRVDGAKIALYIIAAALFVIASELGWIIGHLH